MSDFKATGMTKKKNKKRFKILLVQKDEQYRQRIQKILSDSPAVSFGVHSAANLTHAREALSDWPFDAVLLDLLLPESQGLSTLDHIRKIAPNLPIIVLAEAMDASLLTQAAARGAFGFIFNTAIDPQQLKLTIFFAIERHRREQIIANKEHRYRKAIETLKDAYYEMDLTGVFTYVNEETARHLGRPQHEIPGSSALDYNETPEQSKRNIKVYSEVLKTDKTGILDSTLTRSDGSLITVEHRVSLLRDDQGTPIGFSGISRDITKQQTVQEALQASNEKYQNILDNIQDGYYEVDLKGRLTFYNEGMSTIFGFSVDDLNDKDNRSYMDKANAEKVYRAFRHVYETGDLNYDLQFEVFTKQGVQRFAESSVYLMEDDQGHPIGFRGVVRDITSRKESEIELIQAKEKAEAATLAKSEFLANMSHEIRTPMNGIIGMYNLLQSTPLTDEQAEFVRTGKESADTLLSIINDILDFSKMEAGKLEIETIDFDLHNTMDTLVLKPAAMAQKKGLELVYAIDHKVPSLLLGDPGRLRQILKILISNAIKFTHYGEVLLKAEVQEETQKTITLMFTVRDTGIGILKSDQDYLFKSFQQVDNSSTRKYGGTGLGLAIAKGLTELLGGKMGVESEFNQGSTFWFTMKFTKGEAIPKADPIAPDAVRAKRILIVDDNQTNLDILEGYLKLWNCNCDRANNGPLALSIMKAVAKSGAPYDVVIIDMLMPMMDGAELGRRINADKTLGNPILIMLTSQGMRGDAAAMKQIGYTAYLNKPVSPSRLYDCLVMVLSKNSRSKTEAPAKIVTGHTLSEENRRRTKILLAEDNTVNQKIALHLLTQMGFHTEVVSNGEEAVAALSARDYDLVFMDIQMPEMDGLAATALIRAVDSKVRNRKIPIIAMTATDTPEDRKICLDAGMDDYIAKPIVPDKLKAMVEQWAARSVPSQIRI